MNKAFVREPEFDGRAFCPRCGALGTQVGAAALNTHVRPEARARLADTAWFCTYPPCPVAYFNLFETVVTTDELNAPVTPKDPDAPLCACFGLTRADVEADAHEPVPVRIRELVARSQSPDAQCATLAANGHCCLPEIRKLYMRLRQSSSS
jgi:hypothetical protein